MMKLHSHRLLRNDAKQNTAQVDFAPYVKYDPASDSITYVEHASISDFETDGISSPEEFTLTTPNKFNIQNIYKQILSDPLYRNSILNMASTAILGGLGFVFWIIIARLYKTENVGIATTLISIMALLSSFTILGLNVSLNRFLPRSPRKSELINSSFTIVTLATILVSIVFFLGLPIFSPQLLFLRSNPLYIVSFTIFIIFCSWNSLVESTFMAFRSASSILIKNVIISVLKLVVPFTLTTFGVYGIFASTSLALSLGVLVSLFILIFKFKIRPSISVNMALIKETGAYSFANYLAGFLLTMPSLVLPIVILDVLSAKYTAYYYIASMIRNILLIIPLATTQALLTEGSYNGAEMKKHVKKAVVTTLLILVPATVLVFFGSSILLQFFGRNYASDASQFLQLYSVSTIFTAILLLASAIMNIKHQIKSLIILNVIAAVCTLGMSCVFLSGNLVGIGWGWLFGQILTGIISILFIIRDK